MKSLFLKNQNGQISNALDRFSHNMTHLFDISITIECILECNPNTLLELLTEVSRYYSTIECFTTESLKILEKLSEIEISHSDYLKYSEKLLMFLSSKSNGSKSITSKYFYTNLILQNNTIESNTEYIYVPNDLYAQERIFIENFNSNNDILKNNVYYDLHTNNKEITHTNADLLKHFKQENISNLSELSNSLKTKYFLYNNIEVETDEVYKHYISSMNNSNVGDFEYFYKYLLENDTHNINNLLSILMETNNEGIIYRGMFILVDNLIFNEEIKPNVENILNLLVKYLTKNISNPKIARHLYEGIFKIVGNIYRQTTQTNHNSILNNTVELFYKHFVTNTQIANVLYMNNSLLDLSSTIVFHTKYLTMFNISNISELSSYYQILLNIFDISSIHSILDTLIIHYNHSLFSETFFNKYSHYVTGHRILSSTAEDIKYDNGIVVNEKVLVYMLVKMKNGCNLKECNHKDTAMKNIFNSAFLNLLFKPNIKEFIKSNIGKIIYYLRKEYFVLNNSTCIYDILSFILSHYESSTIEMITEYLHVDIEYYLQRHECKKKSEFMKRIKRKDNKIKTMSELVSHTKTEDLLENIRYVINNSHMLSNNISDHKLLRIIGDIFINSSNSVTKLKSQSKFNNKQSLIPNNSNYDVILNNYLLKSTNNTSIYLYVIQEYIKHKKSNDIYLEQYRNSKYVYKGRGIRELFGIEEDKNEKKNFITFKVTNTNNNTTNNSNSNSLTIKHAYYFLYSLLIQYEPSYEYYQWIVLLDDTTVREVCVYLVRDLWMEYKKREKSNNNNSLTDNNLIDILFNSSFTALLANSISEVFSVEDILNIELINTQNTNIFDTFLSSLIEVKEYHKIIHSIYYKAMVQHNSMNKNNKTKNVMTLTKSSNNSLKYIASLYSTYYSNIPNIYNSPYKVDIIYAYIFMHNYYMATRVETEEYSALSIIVRNKVVDNTIENNTNILNKLSSTFKDKIEKYERNIKTEEEEYKIDMQVESDYQILNNSNSSNNLSSLEIIKLRHSKCKNFGEVIKRHYWRIRNNSNILEKNNSELYSLFCAYITSTYMSKYMSHKDKYNYIIERILENGNDINEVFYEYACIKYGENNKEEAVRALEKVMETEKNKENIQTNNSTVNKSIVKYCEIMESKKVYEEGIKRLKSNSIFNKDTQQTNNSNNATDSNLIKLHFLYAKYLEKNSSNDLSSNTLVIYYYFLSLTYNYESIPRLIHLVNQIDTFTYVDNTSSIDIDYLVGKQNIKDRDKILSYIVSRIVSSKSNKDKNNSTLNNNKENVNENKVITQTKEIKLNTQTNNSNLLIYFTQYYQHLLTNHKNPFILLLITNILSLYPNLLYRTILIMKHNSSIADSIDSVGTVNTREFIKILMDIGKHKSDEETFDIKDIKGLDKIFKTIKKSKIGIPGKIFNDVYIESISSTIKQYHSLQKPKLITLIGSDGVKYPFIVKYKDDLRRDSRFMDANNIINMLFTNTKYKVITYDVIPFTENSGILEYKDNLVSLKNIINSTVNEKVLLEISRHATKYIKKRKMDKTGILKVFEILNKHSELFIMRKYIYNSSTDVEEIYEKLNNFTLSYAVLANITYLMGLGDRHLENILITNNMNTLNVDLNLIFELNKSLSVPETVPFRMTNLMVSGLNHIDEFRHYYVDVLQILVKNRNTIISNLLSFAYDPIAIKSITKITKSKSNSTNSTNLTIGTQHNLQQLNNIITNLNGSNNAKQILTTITNKLCSKDIKERGNKIIDEAQDIDNLSEMYIGWGSYF